MSSLRVKNPNKCINKYRSRLSITLVGKCCYRNYMMLLFVHGSESTIYFNVNVSSDANKCPFVCRSVVCPVNTMMEPTPRSTKYAMSSAKRYIIAEQTVSSLISCFYTFAILFLFNTAQVATQLFSFNAHEQQIS